MAETRCTNCGQPMSDADRVCPSCGAPAPLPGTDEAPPAAPVTPHIEAAPAATPAPADEPAAPAPAASAAGGLATPLNLARIAKIAALLFFLLPWVTVSCAGTPLVSLSGMDLATGQVSVTNPMTGTSESRSEAPELLVIVGALLIVGALVAGFVLRRRLAGLVGLVASAAAAALLAYSVFVGVRGRMRAEIDESGAASGQAGGPSSMDLGQMISIDVAIGFWLTLIALAAAIFLNWRLYSDRSAPG